MKISLIGFYGAGNLGDDLLLKASLDFLNQTQALNKLKFEEIRVFCNSSEKLKNLSRFIPRQNLKLVNKFNILNLIINLSDSRYLFFGGGSILQDQTSLRSLIYYVFVILLAKILRTRIFFISQGIGPLNLKISRFLVKKIFHLIDYSSFRDSRSYRIAKNVFKAKNIFRSADLVWSLDLGQFINLGTYSFFTAKEQIDNKKEKKIIISLRQFKTLKTNFLFFFSNLLDQKFFFKTQKNNLSIDLICLSQEDLLISEDFKKTLFQTGFPTSKIRIFDISSFKGLQLFFQSVLRAQSQTKNLEIWAFLTRFHSIVLISLLVDKLSLRGQITGISYDPKVSSLCKALQVSYLDLFLPKQGLGASKQEFFSKSKKFLPPGQLLKSDFRRIRNYLFEAKQF